MKLMIKTSALSLNRARMIVRKHTGTAKVMKPNVTHANLKFYLLESKSHVQLLRILPGI